MRSLQQIINEQSNKLPLVTFFDTLDQTPSILCNHRTESRILSEIKYFL